MDYCDFFSADSHSDGTHSLQRTIGEQVITCNMFQNLMKIQTRLHLGWPDIFSFE